MNKPNVLTTAFICLVIEALAAVLLCATCHAEDVVLLDAAMTMDCASTPFDTIECIMREDGIVVAECDISHAGQVSCIEIYAD
jgi:hypothetical protein